MLIPSNYVIEEGKEAPEGSVTKKCKFCGKSFALPKDIADQVSDSCDSDECKTALEKEAVEQAHALMKAPASAEAEKSITTALGK